MNESIEEMLQRWDEEPTPQLSLQLAEEYRRHGQLEEGTAILEQALQLHPQHVAARVAYGRFLLESLRSEEACQVLEDVVEEDPTHLVANKLLVGLYLQTDRAKDARDRLDLYKLLNESDPEIAVLELQLAPGVPPTAVDAAGRVFALSETPPPDLRGLVAETGQAGSLQARPAAAASEGPFGDIWAAVDWAGYARAIGAEGIFPVTEPEALEVPIEVVEEPVEEIEAAPVESEPVSAGLAAEAAEPKPEPEVGAPVPEMGATATLAQLYLDQGHLDDAVRAFEEVLEREHDHAEARAGLAEARRRLGGVSTSEDVMEEEAEDETLDARDRKIQVLRQYLDRLRAAAGRQ